MTINSDFKKKGYEFVNGRFLKKKKKNKFGNKKIIVDGIKFDSVKESKLYGELKVLKRAKEIKGFERQVKFEIKINDTHIANYFLDFKIIHNNGDIEYVDVKGYDKGKNKWIYTELFKLKKKLIEAIYNIKIKYK